MSSDYEPDIDLTELLAFSDDEVVTHAHVRDVTPRPGTTIALITLDNGEDYRRPNTFGARGLLELDEVLVSLTARAASGEIQAVAITGKPYILAAGADLSKVGDVPSAAAARSLAQLGHRVFHRLSALGVPSFVYINGLALGGGLEIGLHADYRTVSSAAAGIGLPEVFLGLIPGWGGSTLLPRLIGIENALEVVISNPLKNNRMLKPERVRELGIADELFPSATFLEDSIAWTLQVLDGREVPRPASPGRLERTVKWPLAIQAAKKMLTSRIGTVPRSPYAALTLLDQAKSGSVADGFRREDDALAELIVGDQFPASIYAFNLVQKRAKRPAGAPDAGLARRVNRVGIVGAGLMASQFAVLFLRRLQVPVIITDVDQNRVDAGVERIRADIDALHDKGRISRDERNRLSVLVSGTTDHADFAGCDWVIEAVFEELSVKQDVFRSIEQHVSPDTVLATNTSSLSVSEIGSVLTHPERLIGFHFFNPVAIMPLVELVRASQSDDAAIATGFAVAKALKKNAVLVADAPGFVVNRLLAKVMGEAARALDDGTPLPVVERSLAPIGLPMGPFQLMNLVGWKVAAHVQDTMVERFPERFYASSNLHRLAELDEVVTTDNAGRVTGLTKAASASISVGSNAVHETSILRRVEDELSREIALMVDEGVVAAVDDIDLCLILGAGWPFQAGGASPYLDRSGASERAIGRTFHTPLIRGVGAADR
ncbi:3-hydroxyacyl-CoA dehydrogenase NAD-binding domain-containing protein [Mycetocola reblochoni]|uniref:Enoyl-CoA hydratase / 3-hydroxyacyl-CoA dehydrogenase / 3-hydroxybutyryl-CoA epimerase n=2 Tax=Mycetocola reblochoni TaxID=331618 RepID=A0A1R4K6U8_9MICO|nr:3-hydroxyacyl-CoA dehydrogenase NAD-binding domain-containing protein [Mycetocola reblochoni]RLP67974.1 3-hydroxyacyl-CoA dehydrogenase [Mycetocola reblochoni]SJN39978.1 Enoyl-CoA hydratase / 3-hydroxyacyl-CoA dehydrogenase / 3-hydroxybutyryl-CoA epimerase [Mycetocola reblochoni REB411]